MVSRLESGFRERAKLLQANEKSISGERFFIRLRLIHRSAVNDFVFFSLFVKYCNTVS